MTPSRLREEETGAKSLEAEVERAMEEGEMWKGRGWRDGRRPESPSPHSLGQNQSERARVNAFRGSFSLNERLLGFG